MTEDPDLRELEASAGRHRTPSGVGFVTWREWGCGAPLLLLHGGFGTWRHWVRNIATLAGAFRVIAPDLPGMGESDHPAPVQEVNNAQVPSFDVARMAALTGALPFVHPALVLPWGRDNLFLGYIAEMWPVRAGRRVARVLIVPGAGHWLGYEAAGLVNSVILEQAACSLGELI